tara:strand:+ start:1419 stop:2054 length:636 start_codon:yes stop_codon:yes gene_type:complete
MIAFNLFIIATIYKPQLPYYFNPNIHNFGNIGMGGYVHSRLAPIARRVIDYSRYNGENIRENLLKPYQYMSQLDLCCGIGDSTMINGLGIDTSKQMLEMAAIQYSDKKFYQYNAEDIRFTNRKFDIVTCMFALHEIPYKARDNIINNAKKNADYEIIIMDISSNYSPSKIMLSGEPYLIEYLNNIDKQMNKHDFIKTTYIDNHVDIWRFKF